METRPDIIDFHAHILPGADHGSDSVDTTLWQLKQARLYGVKRIIATPHFYPTSHSLESFLERRAQAYDKLMENLPSDAPMIKLGAEILACRGIENLEGIERLCIEGTRCLMLELPFSDFSEDYPQSVKYLCAKGFDIVLAHAERYNPKNIETMIAAGALVQLNAEALSGMFIDSSVKRWVCDGRFVALGSDIHMTDKTAYRKFSKARKKLAQLGITDFNFCDALWN